MFGLNIIVIFVMCLSAPVSWAQRDLDSAPEPVPSTEEAKKRPQRIGGSGPERVIFYQEELEEHQRSGRTEPIRREGTPRRISREELVTVEVDRAIDSYDQNAVLPNVDRAIESIDRRSACEERDRLAARIPNLQRMVRASEIARDQAKAVRRRGWLASVQRKHSEAEARCRAPASEEVGRESEEPDVDSKRRTRRGTGLSWR
jgi:hypothetical protein